LIHPKYRRPPWRDGETRLPLEESEERQGKQTQFLIETKIKAIFQRPVSRALMRD
jgi:hypothetical protein